MLQFRTIKMRHTILNKTGLSLPPIAQNICFASLYTNCTNNLGYNATDISKNCTCSIKAALGKDKIQ